MPKTDIYRATCQGVIKLKWLPCHGPDLIRSPEQGSQPSGSADEFDTETKLSKGKYLDTAMTVFRIRHAEIAMNYLED